MTGKIVKVGVALVIAAVAVSTVARGAANTSEKLAKQKLQRKIELYQQTERHRREIDKQSFLRNRIDGSRGVPAAESFNSPIIRDYPLPRNSFSSSSGVVPPPPSPGQDIGFTSYDFQSNGSQGYNVARTPGGAKIHFTWMSFKYIPPSPEDNARKVLYSSYTDPNLYPNMTPSTVYNGVEVTGDFNRGGYVGIDVDNTNHAALALHQAENDYDLEAYKPWHANFPFSSNLFQLFKLTGYDNSCPEQTAGKGGVLWPRLTGDRGAPFLHEIAHSNVNDCPQDKLWYWRFNGAAWSGPAIVSNTQDIAYVLGADAGSDKVAVAVFEVTPGYSEVAYIESTTNGSDWLALVPNVDPPPTPTLVTDYVGAGGDLSGFNHLSCTYDNSGYLHILWDESEIQSHTRVKHWSQNPAANNIRTVAQAYWDNPVSNGLQSINLSKPTIGIGDGSTMCSGNSNNNYIYVTFVQFGGSTPTEENDYSSEYSFAGRLGGYMNGEVYLSVSNSLGDTWSPKVNLTNTKTPGCQPGLANPLDGTPANPDSVCRSEHWATIGRVVKDVDVFFISDMDAGGIPYGEGSWQLNPVHYVQLAGPALTSAGGVCPIIAPVFASSLAATEDCEYNAPRNGSKSTTFTISNFGNATLTNGAGAGRTITQFAPAGPTITGVTSGPYSIAPSQEIVETATFNSNNAPEGLYLGQISITHNDADPFNPSPKVYPIEFFVFDIFFCPEDEILKTGVASPGVLALAVASSGRFAEQGVNGTLWRHNDSSLSIVDGSVLLAYGPQGPNPEDYTVFNRYADAMSNGQNGFRSQSELCIDTVGGGGYGTGAGYASAGAYMTTKDSVMGVNMSWYFPQSSGTGTNEFIIVNYLIFPGPNWIDNGSPAINDVATGMIADLELYPGQGLSRLGLDTMQSGNHNHALIDDPRNLAYARGTNRAGTSVVDPPGPSAPNDATRFRAGIAVPTGMEGAYIGNFGTDLTNGASDQFLYSRLQAVAGAEIGETQDTDLYVIAGFDKGVAYTAQVGAGSFFHKSTVRSHTVVFASDTIDDNSFKATIDLAAGLINAGGLPFAKCAVCPCAYDPGCDGVTGVVDVTHVVGGAFRNILADPSVVANPSQACCHFDSRDVNADGVISVLDVTMTVDVAFRNKNYLTSTSPSFVDPCTKWKEWN